MSRQQLRSFDSVAADMWPPPSPDALLATLRDVSPSPRLIEIGIGTGRIAVPLAAAGVRVTGIDVSSKMLAQLRTKRDGIDVMFAEAARPPFRAASFDAALFVHILHLVPDVEATVRAATAVVRRGGLIIRLTDDHNPSGHHIDFYNLMWDVIEERTGIRRPADSYATSGEVLRPIAGELDAAIEEQMVLAYDAPFNARHATNDILLRRDFPGAWDLAEARVDEIASALEQRFLERWGPLDIDRSAAKTVELMTMRLP